MTTTTQKSKSKMAMTFAAAALAVGVLATSFTSEAHAGNGGEAFVGGLVGGIIGGAISRPRYYEQPTVVYRRAAPRRVYRTRGLSKAQRCARAYRSYDARSNTWIDYSGNVRICRK